MPQWGIFQEILFNSSESICFSFCILSLKLLLAELLYKVIIEWRTLKTSWDKFWIILKDWEAVVWSWKTLNILDLNLTDEYELYLSDDEIFTWTWLILMNPEWEDFQVYYDMKTNGWGWTMIWKNFWWPGATGNISNLNLWDS